MSAYGCIPFPRLDIFPFGTLLQIQVSVGVEYMKVDDRVEQFAAAMTFSACSGSGDISLLIYDREHFLVIIALCHCFYIRGDYGINKEESP